MEERPKLYLGLLSAASVGCFALGGINAGFGAEYLACVSAIAAHYSWQIKTLNIEDRETCWNLFQSNRWLGLSLVFAIMLGKYKKEQKS